MATIANFYEKDLKDLFIDNIVKEWIKSGEILDTLNEQQYSPRVDRAITEIVEIRGILLGYAKCIHRRQREHYIFDRRFKDAEEKGFIEWFEDNCERVEKGF